jgi:hypothetical protein
LIYCLLRPGVGADATKAEEAAHPTTVAVNEPAGAPGRAPNLARRRSGSISSRSGIDRWTLHDCRRTVTNYLDDRRLGGSATAILAHKTSNGKTKERERLAPVTEQHYGRSQRIDLEAEGMALWVKALLAAYAKESRRFRDLRTQRLAALSASKSDS